MMIIQLMSSSHPAQVSGDGGTYRVPLLSIGAQVQQTLLKTDHDPNPGRTRGRERVSGSLYYIIIDLTSILHYLRLLFMYKSIGALLIVE